MFVFYMEVKKEAKNIVFRLKSIILIYLANFGSPCIFKNNFKMWLLTQTNLLSRKLKIWNRLCELALYNLNKM